MNKVNLMDLFKQNIVKEGSQNIKVPIKKPNGQTYSGKTYMIPLEYLYYNDQNGRIGVALSEYETQNGKIRAGHNEEYNMVIQKMLVDDDNPKTKNDMKVLKEDILDKGQEVVGYVLNDGRVIDGNRRFTAKRLLQQDENVLEDQYFEAVILEELSLENHNDHKLIKSLELQIQFGRVEKVDYDPIDRAIDAYKTIIKEKIMTAKEYAKYANLTTVEVNKRILEAELILKFLKYANAETDNYSLAKQLGLDGPMQDLVPQYRKIKGKENETAILNALFAKIIQLKLTKENYKEDFRNIVKQVIGSKREEKFLEEMEDLADTVQDTLSEAKVIKNNLELTEIVTKNDKLVNILTEIKKVSREQVETVRNIKDTSQPITLARRALNSLNSIDSSISDELVEAGDEEFLKILNDIRQKLEIIGKR